MDKKNARRRARRPEPPTEHVSGPFRTTRSKKIFSPWAGDNLQVVALDVPKNFCTATLLEQAEQRADKAIFDCVDDDVDSSDPLLRLWGDPDPFVAQRGASSAHAARSELPQDAPSPQAAPAELAQRAPSPHTALCQTSPRAYSPAAADAVHAPQASSSQRTSPPRAISTRPTPPADYLDSEGSRHPSPPPASRLDCAVRAPSRHMSLAHASSTEPAPRGPAHHISPGEAAGRASLLPAVPAKSAPRTSAQHVASPHATPTKCASLEPSPQATLRETSGSPSSPLATPLQFPFRSASPHTAPSKRSRHQPSPHDAPSKRRKRSLSPPASANILRTANGPARPVNCRSWQKASGSGNGIAESGILTDGKGSTAASGLGLPTSASAIRPDDFPPKYPDITAPPIPLCPPQQDAEMPRTTGRKGRGKERSKLRFKQRRRVRRAQDAEVEHHEQSVVKKVALSRLESAVPIKAPVVLGAREGGTNAESGDGTPSISAAPSGFVGHRPMRSERDDHSIPSKEEVLKLGFRYVKWDGTTPHVILDGEDRVIAVLVGAPRDEKWPNAMKDACAALDNARGALGAEREEKLHRRGKFSVVASGISYGGGQKEPCNRSLQQGEQRIVDTLLANPAIQRIAGFGSSAFRLFCPDLHRSYAENMEALLAWNPALRPNFKNSVFGSITLNLGPRTQTFKHTDFQNRAAGLCAITALGSFDHTQSGHIILWELEMIIEFPANSTILIPSALVKHSNTAVQAHESRFSITQYSAGGLFRFVECGFRTEKAFLASGGRYEQSGEERWRRGLDLFSKWSDLFSGSA